MSKFLHDDADTAATDDRTIIVFFLNLLINYNKVTPIGSNIDTSK